VIRKAKNQDLEQILSIYDTARAYMACSGNPTQWGDGYPFPDLLNEDIAAGRLYVVCDAADTPHGVFAFLLGEDPTYATIDGAWRSSGPYGTIHRLASDGTLHRLFGTCLTFCRNVMPHIRADTHEKNKTMQHLFEKYGFVRCGVIDLKRGGKDDLRIAYELSDSYAKENGEF